MDPCKRIFELLAARGIEQKTFAEVLGVSVNIVSTWRTGRTKSYQKYLPQIAEVLNTSVEYLLTGQKEKPATVSGDGQDPNTVRIAGRDGSLFSKRLTDEQLAALKSIIEQMPEANADYL